MLPRFAIIVLCLGAYLSAGTVKAAGPFERRPFTEAELRAAIAALPENGHKEPERLVAALLAVTVGPFGAHRLYLGTDVKVPLAYGLTFGGFGVLVVIDLAHILFTKDLAAYRNNKQILMWSRAQRSTATTPP